MIRAERLVPAAALVLTVIAFTATPLSTLTVTASQSSGRHGFTR